MRSVKEIKKAISNLPTESLAELRDWFQEFDSQSWDDQIEADVASGKLDPLLDEAEEGHW